MVGALHGGVLAGHVNITISFPYHHPHGLPAPLHYTCGLLSPHYIIYTIPFFSSLLVSLKHTLSY